jgi:hypothetical protein
MFMALRLWWFCPGGRLGQMVLSNVRADNSLTLNKYFMMSLAECSANKTWMEGGDLLHGEFVIRVRINGALR